MGDSIIVGLPYAWLGETSRAQSGVSGNGARFVGTIGKIKFDFRNGLTPADQSNIILPKPQETERVIKKGGAIWGSFPEEDPPKKHLGKSQYSTAVNPVRNFYSGTAISKGKNEACCDTFVRTRKL